MTILMLTATEDLFAARHFRAFLTLRYMVALPCRGQRFGSDPVAARLNRISAAFRADMNALGPLKENATLNLTRVLTDSVFNGCSTLSL